MTLFGSFFMVTNYPPQIDAFTNPSGTNTLDSPDHALQHTNINGAVIAIENVLGTNSGTSVLKNFVTGNMAARTNNETFGTPKFTLGSDATGDLFYRSAGGTITRLGIGSNGQFVTTAGVTPSWGTITQITGQNVQQVHMTTGAVGTGGTVIPFDDTIPQITEGNQYMTLAVTPTNASNKLVIEGIFVGGHSAVDFFTVTLFQDATANALAAVSAYFVTGQTIVTLPFKYEMTAGGTVSTTFRVRAGSTAAGTTTFNGAAGARVYGGIINSYMRITEVKV